MIKAILFDMNGIIIDDEHIHELAFKETVKDFAIDLSHQDYLECCAGKTDRAGYEAIAKKFMLALPMNELLEKKSQLYLKLFPIHKKSYPGVINLIHSLAGRYLLTVTSNASRSEVDLVTREFEIAKDLTTTVSADDVTKGKPNPEPYLITCQKLGINPTEAIAIEDSKSGVTAAKAAGCWCIGVTTTHTQDDLKLTDAIVESFSEITDQLINSFGK